jgi:flagellar motor protein MotB
MSHDDEATSGATSSFTDLMTSLAVIFVLLTVALFNRKTGAQQQERAALVAALRGPLHQAGLPDSSVRDDSTSVIIVFPDSALFDRGKDTLRAAGVTLVRSLMPAVADTLCSPTFRSDLQTVVVEGHTDRTIPEGMSAQRGRLYNLQLSQKRSMNFVSVTTDGLLRVPAMASAGRDSVFDCIIKLTSATGRGQEENLSTSSDTAQAQRRVILRIRFKSARSDSLVPAVHAAAVREPN